MTIEPKNPEFNYYPISLEPIKPQEGLAPNMASVPLKESNIVPSANGTIMNGGTLQSLNFITGLSGSGWKLDSNGNLEANDGNFRGDICVGSIYYTKQVVYTSFESADGWTAGTNLNIKLGGSAIQTTATINTQKYINDEIFGGKGVYFTTKNPYFQCGLECADITKQIIYFGVGNLSIGDGTECGFGFKIVDGTLYALHTTTDDTGNNAVEYTTVISGITLTQSNEYKVIYTSNSKIEFYINNVLKATHTTNLILATSDDDPVLMTFSIKNTEALNKIIYLRYAMFVQDY